MDIWRFGSLEARRDILRRFFLRLLWSFVGSAVSFAAFDFRDALWWFFGAPTALAILGVIADAYRLGHPEISVQHLRRILAAFGLGLLLGLVGMFLFMGINTKRVMAVYAEAQLLEMAVTACTLRAGMHDDLLERHDRQLPRMALQFSRVHREHLKGNQAHAALWLIQRYYDLNPSVPVPADLVPILDSLPPDPRGRFRSLKDEPAPDFELDTLSGGRVRLSDHRGKNVVILEFWATWCGPCRRSLPIVERVAEKFRDQGVILYAVNRQEKPDDIRAFLDEQGMDVTVALDTDGATGKKYAQGIPTIAIVGKDGIIKAYYVGPRREDELVEAVKAALGAETSSGQDAAPDEKPSGIRR